jgi:hypothetical protein
MAYSPVEQGRLLDRRALLEIAERHTASPAQVALAWLLHRDGILPIPKAGTVEHVRENRAAADLVLTPDDLNDLDRRSQTDKTAPAGNALKSDTQEMLGPPRPRPTVQLTSSPRIRPDTFCPALRSSIGFHGTSVKSWARSISAKRPLTRSTGRR